MSCCQFLFRTFCLFVCLLSSVSLYAQESKPFRVDSYIPEKFSDLEWRVNGSLSGSGDDGERDWFSRTDVLQTSNNDHDSYNWNFQGSTVLNRLHQTIPRYSIWRLQFNGAYNNRDDSRTEVRNDSIPHYRHSVDRQQFGSEMFALNATLSTEQGKYLVSDLLLSFEFTASANYGKTLNSSDLRESESKRYYDDEYDLTQYLDRQTSRGDRKQYGVSSAAAIGWGRIYQGEFAVAAMNFMEVLRKNGLLDGQPTYEQMQELTQIIFEYRMYHSIDSRLRRIECLDSILTYLDTEGIISDPGPRATALVQDVWDYFPQSHRPFGWTIKAGIGYQLSYISSQNAANREYYEFHGRGVDEVATPLDTFYLQHDKHYTYSHYADTLDEKYTFVNFQYLRPLSHHWHLEFSGNLRKYLNGYRMVAVDVGVEQRVEIFNKWLYYASAALTWSVDSRTEFATSASFRHSTEKNLGTYYDIVYSGISRSIVPLDSKSSSSDLVFSASGLYRLSVPTTLSARVSLFDSWDELLVPSRPQELSEESFRWNVGLTIQHYLF